MAALIYARRAERDLARFVEFFADDPAQARAAIAAIEEAVEILERHPLIGRPAPHGMRELVISRGNSGYVALYDYHQNDELVVILSIRHQREAGYGDTD